MIKDTRALILAVCLVASVAYATQKNRKPPHVPVTAAQAQKASLAKYRGEVIVHAYLEDEDGKWQYATFIKSGKKTREIMVDARTGKIASVEVVTAREVAKEKAAEAKRKGAGS